MKQRYLVTMLFVVFPIAIFCVEENALRGSQSSDKMSLQRKVKIIAYPSRKYIKKERLGDDWVVEIEVPERASATTPYCECDRSQPPFRGTDVRDEGVSNGKRLFRFIAGARARLTSAYSFDEWARSWRVSYYGPFEPRGPQVRPRD